MLEQAPAPPTGPRASRRPGPTRVPRTTRPSDRGGIQKRRADTPRTDKDGDLVMDAGRGSGRGFGIRGRATPQTQTNGDPNSSHDTRSKRRGGVSLNTTAMQQAILRGVNSGDAIIREPRRGLRPVGISEQGTLKGRGRGRRDGYDQIVVRGLKESKAVSNPDGGIKILLSFLERKATAPNAPLIRIEKSHPEGDALIISVRPEDTPSIMRLNGFSFAGAVLNIEMSAGNASRLDNKENLKTSDDTMDLKAKITSILGQRYSRELKLLNLSFLGNDPELVNLGLFQTSSRGSKFFPALMKVCDEIFGGAQQKAEAVMSVTLANNALDSIASVSALSQTFPALKNLDLSNNKFKNLESLAGWRWKFKHLDHLVLSENPLVTEVPDYVAEILKWYPTLRTLNTTQVRSDEEVTATAKGKFPLPVLPASFRDEASIGENFVKQFFPAFDSDRTALAAGYYDSQSSFSLSVNVSAPRAPESTNSKAVSWESYIKKSRNLVRVTHLPAKMARMYTGVDSIRDVWLTLPNTRHPDLLAEPQKWNIECHSVPGLPDPNEQSPSGVGGLIVMLHGEFLEIDVSTNKSTTIRSFDRTFVLGPGRGVGGIRVANDMLVLRAYGGSEAWIPDSGEPPAMQSSQSQLPRQLAMPDGFGVAVPGKSEELLQKEVLAMELSNQTGMTLEFSGMCLEQSGWSLEGAAVAFQAAKANLPPEAFVSF